MIFGKKNVEKFLKDIEKDKELSEKFSEITGGVKAGVLSRKESLEFVKQKIIPFITKVGYKFNEKDFINYLVSKAKSSGIISNDSLSSVKGGTAFSKLELRPMLENMCKLCRKHCNTLLQRDDVLKIKSEETLDETEQ